MLEIENLDVRYPSADGDLAAVQDFSLTISKGECVGIVGESGAGKSQAFLAIMGLLPTNARVHGSARFNGTQLLGLPEAELNRIRGTAITMVFQDPLTSLTPHMRIGDQLAESLLRHHSLSRRAVPGRAADLLARVHVSDPNSRLAQYPHELSGGMRQRVMIAMALACEPSLVIADEPTTALDVTIQAQILALLAELKRDHQMSLVLITHDLGVVAGLADRVAVMRAGQIVEQGGVSEILKAPRHAYTRALVDVSSRGQRAARTASVDAPAVLQVSDLHVQFPTRGRRPGAAPLRAVDGLDFALRDGEVIGIVGESGSGKSTLARAILHLVKPKSGKIVWLGNAVAELAETELKAARRDLQIVFQDPLASLNPRMRVSEIVAEPLLVHEPVLDRAQRRKHVLDMLQKVALSPALLERYPHELSGGQCQRVAIARAMILRPKLLVCDEAISALDVTTQAQIVALLQELSATHGLALLFISHNLDVVHQLCERILVLYLGKAMELGPAQTLGSAPAHPYTRSLLDAIPVADPAVQPQRLLRALPGELPSPLAPPSGCVFHTRCPYAIEICRRRVPAWEAVAEMHQVACHRWRDLKL